MTGATRTARFTLRDDRLRFWSPALGKWVVEPEVFDVWVGGDSTVELHGELTLTR